MELKHTVTKESRNTTELLIVPYGIETKWEGGFVNDPDAFNRTLWN